jgi:type I restriction-modification system DNA methylase subunit
MPAKATLVCPDKNKSLESWIWEAARSIWEAKDAPNYKAFILVCTKLLCNVFDDGINRLAAGVGSRKTEYQPAARDHKLERFYLSLVPDHPEDAFWSVIRKALTKIEQRLPSNTLRTRSKACSRQIKTSYAFCYPRPSLTDGAKTGALN